MCTCVCGRKCSKVGGWREEWKPENKSKGGECRIEKERWGEGKVEGHSIRGNVKCSKGVERKPEERKGGKN